MATERPHMPTENSPGGEGSAKPTKPAGQKEAGGLLDSIGNTTRWVLGLKPPRRPPLRESQLRAPQTEQDLVNEQTRDILASLEDADNGGSESPAELAGAKSGEGNADGDDGGPKNPRGPEALGGPENPNFPEKEKRPSFEFVVMRIRKLEAIRTREKYDPGVDRSYPVLAELDLRYKQFQEYFSIMESPEIAQLTQKLEDVVGLEASLIRGEKTIKLALELFDERNNKDPGLRGLERQEEILKGIKNPSKGQEIALLVTKQQLKSRETLEGNNGVKAQSKLKIERLEQALRGLPGQNPEQRILVRELEKEKQRLQAYETYNSPNILVERIKSLRGNPAREAELRQALVEFLGDEKGCLETEINLIKVIGSEQQITNELRKPGQVEIEEWEKKALDEDREAERKQEQGEIPFRNLPAFSEFINLQNYIDHGYIDSSPRNAQGEDQGNYREMIESLRPRFPDIYDVLVATENSAGFAGVTEVIERQIERYLFKAFRLGITKGVHDAFDDLYTQYKIPEVDYYGGVRRVDERHIRDLAALFTAADRGDKFRLNGWDNKFLGVIGYVSQRAGMRMESVVSPNEVDIRGLDPEERALLVRPDLYRFRGEWDPELADRKAEAIIAKRMYWEKSVTGYYQFKIDSDVSKNPYAAEQLSMAADQWIAYLQSGVIPKNPQDQLREWQQFIGQLAPLAEKIYRQMYPEDAATLEIHPENKDRASKEIRRLRQGLKFRAEAPIAAYANAVDEAEAFASVKQTISEDTEGPEVVREGYGALNGMVALALDELENNPEYSRVFFQPEGSRGYLSANNAAQRLLMDAVCKQLEKELAQRCLSDKVTNTGRIADSLNQEIAQIRQGIDANRNNPDQVVLLRERLAHLEERQNTVSRVSASDEKEVLNVRITKLNVEIANLKEEAGKADIDPKRQGDLNNRLVVLERGRKQKIKERQEFSKVIRRENHQKIGLDQSREDFLALYGKLDDQDDFKLLPEAEQKIIRKQKELEAAAAIQSAITILNITGQLSARSGPTIKIFANPESLKYQYKIEELNEMINENNDLLGILDIPEEQRTDIQKARAAEISRRQEQVNLNTQLEIEKARTAYEQTAKKLRDSGSAIDRREDRVPVRTVVRFAQYAVHRAEKVWAEEADKIMKSRLNRQDKDKAIQNLCLAIIPDAWNVKKNLPDKDRKLNLSDVLEGVYREALDRVIGDWVTGKDGSLVNRVIGQGFRATLEVPVVVEEGGKRVIRKQSLKDAAGNTLYLEDIDRLPESNAMLMAYYGTEEIMTNTISLPYKVKEAKAGGGGLFGRALRILDPAFNRLNREDKPDLNDFQKLQRAIHAGVEAQWQRHFQIKIEVLERSVIGADIRKNKTGRKEDRYKIIDGNPRNNLLEFGRERLYVTGRIINHAAEVLTHADRRSRRAPDLGLYSPMQHESEYDESAVEDTREYMGLIDTMSAVQASREGARLDFLYLKLKGIRWGVGYKQRVALESGPVEQGKQHTGLLEKVYNNGDRQNKMWDNWIRSYRNLSEHSGYKALGKEELKIMDATADVELEDFISTTEGSDERLKLSTENAYPDLGYYRLAQAPLWKDGVDPFLPDGILNFERLELGKNNTLLGSDNGTSRHTTGIFFERVNQWRSDPKKGHRWYPGSAVIVENLNRKRLIFGVWQRGVDVLKGREVR